MEEIKELIKLIDESSIDEFTYETDGSKIKMKKQAEESTQVNNKVIPQQTSVKNNGMQEQSPSTETAEESQVESQDSKNYDHEILSPMVGTFYSSPNPESDAFVSPGEEVKENTVVCIVEAMKLFNEIEAEVKGTIVEKLAENGELVEFGQPLFRVKSE